MKKFILIFLILSCIKVIRIREFRNKDINKDLVIAIIKHRTDQAIMLMNRGADINYVLDEKSILDLALDNKNTDVLKELIRRDVKINKKNITEIYDLALDDFNSELIDLIKDKYKLEEDLIDKNKYFLFLCYTSNSKEVKRFIEKNSMKPLEVKDKKNRNALIITAMADKIDTFKMLIEVYNLDIQHTDSTEMIPLTAACVYNSKETLEFILKSQNNYTNYIDKALTLAIEGGHTEIVKILIEKGANIEEGKTLLEVASRNGYKEIVELLIEKGVNINKSNNDECDALMLASSRGHIKVVELLIEKGYDVNRRDCEGNNALLLAILSKKTEIAKTLIKAVANIDERSYSGWTPLTLASSIGNKELIELLIEAGADVNRKIKENTDYEYNTEEDSWTALMIASQNGHIEIVKTLIEAGANINHKSKDDWNALIIASQNGHIEIVKTLIEAGANINEKDVCGNTVLMITSQNGHVEVVRTLIEAGANVINKDDIGRTALSFSFPHEDVMKILVQNGAIFTDNESETLFKFLIRSKNQDELLKLIFNGDTPNIKFLSFIYKKALGLGSSNENDSIKNVSRRRKSLDLRPEDGSKLVKSILKEVNINKIFLMNECALNHGSLLINCFLNFAKLCKLDELENVLEIKKLILEALIEYYDKRTMGLEYFKAFETKFNTVRNKINIFVSSLSNALGSVKGEFTVEGLIENLKANNI